MTVELRQATEEDFAPLTTIWAEGWDAGHLPGAPKGLIKLRTAQNFHTRLRGFGKDLYVAGPRGDPTGFVVILQDKIDQFYIRLDQRANGFARRLIEAAEEMLRAHGIQTAVLECFPENARARRFYEKSGWSVRGPARILVDTQKGPFPLDVILYEKMLPPNSVK